MKLQPPSSNIQPAPARQAPVFGLAVGLICACLISARLLASGPAFDRVWAEDGSVFLAEAQRFGFKSLGILYAGYAHEPSRLFALLGAALPLGWYGCFVTVISSVTAGAVAGLVAAVLLDFTGSRLPSSVAAAGLALTPALNVESLGSLANLQWFLIVGACIVLLLPDGRFRRWKAGLATFAALSSPLAAAALACTAIAHGRAGLTTRPSLALLGGLAAQAALMAFGTNSVISGPPRDSGVVNLVSAIRQVAGGGAPIWLAAVTTFAMITALITVLRSAGPRRRFAVAAFTTSAILLVGTCAYSGWVTPRYVACATMIFIVGVAFGISRKPGAIWAPIALVTAAAVGFAFPVPNYRVSGASWSQAVHDRAEGCRRGAGFVRVQISPAGWEATLRCP